MKKFEEEKEKINRMFEEAKEILKKRGLKIESRECHEWRSKYRICEGCPSLFSCTQEAILMGLKTLTFIYLIYYDFEKVRDHLAIKISQVLKAQTFEDLEKNIPSIKVS